MKEKPVVNYSREKIYFETEVDWPSGTFDDVIIQMQEYKEKYSHLMNATIEPEWIGYEDCIYNITGYVWETAEQQADRIRREEELLANWQAEEDARIEKEQAKREAALKRDLKEFERLKAKLGK